MRADHRAVPNLYGSPSHTHTAHTTHMQLSKTAQQQSIKRAAHPGLVDSHLLLLVPVLSVVRLRFPVSEGDLAE